MLDTPVSLLERIRKQPNGPHWERFVVLFAPLLSRWAKRLGVAPTDADNLLQETFVVLFRQLPDFRYDPAKSFRAWLWTLFHRQAQAWRNKRPTAVSMTAAQVESLAAPDSVHEATEAEYRRYLLDRIMHLVKRDFRSPSWDIFWQTSVDGVACVDVARRFGVTPNAVYLIRGRILARIRHELKDLDF